MTLTAAQLNRATLARQLLLKRVHLDPVTAIRKLSALQAQEPASPYLARWTRVATGCERILRSEWEARLDAAPPYSLPSGCVGVGS